MWIASPFSDPLDQWWAKYLARGWLFNYIYVSEPQDLHTPLPPAHHHGETQQRCLARLLPLQDTSAGLPTMMARVGRMCGSPHPPSPLWSDQQRCLAMKPALQDASAICLAMVRVGRGISDGRGLPTLDDTSPPSMAHLPYHREAQGSIARLV